jgi:hypothetical protein
MECIPGAANGKFDFQKEWQISECPNNTTYNVDQTCGKLESGEWNCTHKDYPINELQKVRFNTTDMMFSLTRRYKVFILSFKNTIF